MYLRSEKFAFFDPFSLFVFMDPFSPHIRVREFFFTAHRSSYLHDAQQLMGELSQEENEDFVVRFSAYVHERQHFHDVLLTPYGSKLMRAFFKLGVRVFALLGQVAQYSHSGIKIPLPLSKENVHDQNLLHQAYYYYNICNNLIKDARYTFECSAVISQSLIVLDGLGYPGVAALKKKFAKSRLYGGLPSSFSWIIDDILKAGEEVSVRQMRQLIFMALSTEAPDATLMNYIYSLLDTSKRLKQGHKLKVSLRDTLDNAHDAIHHELTQQLGKNINYFLTELLDEMEQFKFPSVAKDTFLEAFVSFMGASTKARKTFIETPNIILDGYGLLNAPDDFIEPHTYIFTQPINDHAAILENDFEPDTDDLFVIKEVHTPDRIIRILRLAPSPWRIGNNFLKKTPWIEMAKGPSGAVSFLESPDFLHPLKSWWLRAAESDLGLKFVRRRPQKKGR